MVESVKNDLRSLTERQRVKPLSVSCANLWAVMSVTFDEKTLLNTLTNTVAMKHLIKPSARWHPHIFADLDGAHKPLGLMDLVFRCEHKTDRKWEKVLVFQPISPETSSHQHITENLLSHVNCLLTFSHGLSILKLEWPGWYFGLYPPFLVMKFYCGKHILFYLLWSFLTCFCPVTVNALSPTSFDLFVVLLWHTSLKSPFLFCRLEFVNKFALLFAQSDNESENLSLNMTDSYS